MLFTDRKKSYIVMMGLAQIEENRANFSLEVEKLDNKNTALAEVHCTASFLILSNILLPISRACCPS